MAIKLTSTKDVALGNGVKILVHGPAGVGKTFLASTVQNVLMISSEGGLLTLHGFDIPTVEIKSISDLNETFDYVETGEGRKYDWVFLDSVSEIAEVVLSEELAKTPDPRKAYMKLYDDMMITLRGFRDLRGKNVVFTCKQDYIKDDTTGITRYSPLLPGQSLKKQVAYMFDFVLALNAKKDEDGNAVHYFQTQEDLSYSAKNRGGFLDFYEPANLQVIVDKLQSLTQPTEVK